MQDPASVWRQGLRSGRRKRWKLSRFKFWMGKKKSAGLSVISTGDWRPKTLDFLSYRSQVTGVRAGVGVVIGTPTNQRIGASGSDFQSPGKPFPERKQRKHYDKPFCIILNRQDTARNDMTNSVHAKRNYHKCKSERTASFISGLQNDIRLRAVAFDPRASPDDDDDGAVPGRPASEHQLRLR